MSVGIVDKTTGNPIPTAGMPAIDNALSATSTNPVQNAVVTAALANKQDKSDNNLQTTDKTVVGGINELKSGLIDVVSIETHTTNLDTASANGGRLGLTCSSARVGYTAIGIVGIKFMRDQTTFENGICLGLAFIDDSGNVQISARNYTSDSITAFAKVDIIYIKNS